MRELDSSKFEFGTIERMAGVTVESADVFLLLDGRNFWRICGSVISLPRYLKITLRGSENSLNNL
jgi:hypothetical protein